MSSDWPIVRIEDIAEKVAMGPFGSNIKVSTFVEKGIPIISGQHLKGTKLINGDNNFITEEHAEKLKNSNVFRGDVIFTHAGSIGQVAYIPDNSKYGKYVVSQRQFYLRCDRSKVLPEYVTYYFKSREGQHKLLANASQVGVPSIARPSSYLKTIEIPLPTLVIQQNIVGIVNSLEEKIELNRQIKQTLEQIAQAIFKSWFVDFEPVKAKIEAKRTLTPTLSQRERELIVERAAMRAISGKTDEELDQLSPEQRQQLTATAALFPGELEDSELGEITKGWSERKISEWGDVVCGKTPPKNDPDNYGGNIPFIKIPDMHGNVFVSQTSDSLSVKGAELQKKKQIPKGSVCVSCIATVGKVAITSENSHTNQQINSIIPSNTAYTPYLYFSMLERNGLLHDLASGGSATLNLNTGNFSKISLIYPGENLLGEYSKLTTPLFETILEQDRQSQVLIETRDALLPKLLSGEITIGDTQSTAEAVA